MALALLGCHSPAATRNRKFQLLFHPDFHLEFLSLNFSTEYALSGPGGDLPSGLLPEKVVGNSETGFLEHLVVTYLASLCCYTVYPSTFSSVFPRQLLGFSLENQRAYSSATEKTERLPLLLPSSFVHTNQNLNELFLKSSQT